MATATSRPRALPSGLRAGDGVLWQTVGGCAVAILVAALTVVLSETGATRSVAILIVVAGTVWFATTRKVTLALAVLTVYIGVLDGYLKLSTGSTVVTFVRDGLLWGLAAGVLVRAVVERRRLALPPLAGFAVAFVAIVLTELFNPDGGSLYHSLAGARVHLEFVPLFFLVFAYVRSVEALRVFAVLLIAIAVANGIADVIQFHESPQQLAAWGPGYAERVLGLGQFGQGGRTFFNTSGQNFTRPFGLGSDSGDGGLMAAFALGSLLALVSLPGSRRFVPFAILSTVAVVAGIITAQGRAVIVCAVAIVLAYTVFTATSRRGAATATAAVVTALIAAVAVLAVTGGSSSTSLRYSQLSVGNLLQTTETNRGLSLAEIPQYAKDYPFGVALGVTGPGQGVSGAPALAGVIDGETELNFLIAETGVPGALTIVALTLTVLGLAVTRVRREPDPQARVLLAAIFAPVGGMTVLYLVSAVTATTPGGPYLWSAAGLAAYWLIERPRRSRAESAEANSPRPRGRPVAHAIAS